MDKETEIDIIDELTIVAEAIEGAKREIDSPPECIIRNAIHEIKLLRMALRKVQRVILTESQLIK